MLTQHNPNTQPNFGSIDPALMAHTWSREMAGIMLLAAFVRRLTGRQWGGTAAI